MLFLGFVGALPAVISSCDDPGGVGLDLVQEEGGDPMRVTVNPTQVATEPLQKVTGAVRGTSAFSGQVASVLVGEVNDPIIGDRTAIGYIDFRRNVVPTAFASDTVVAVEFRFIRSYTYGDTLDAHTFVLFEMGAAWDPANKPSSTDFGTGTEVMSFSIRASDSLVTVRLPDDWVAERRTLLNNTGFDSLFHGFRIAPLDARSVFGFGATSSVMRVGAKADTVDMISERIFTRIEVKSTVAPPDGLVALVDGIGEAVRVDLSFDEETIANADGVLSRVALTIPVISDLPADGGSASFVRPALQQLNLYGVKSDGTSDLVSTTFADDGGSFEFVGTSAASETALLRVAQKSLLGPDPYSHFRLHAPTTINTLGSVFLPAATDGSGLRVILTVIPK